MINILLVLSMVFLSFQSYAVEVSNITCTQKDPKSSHMIVLADRLALDCSNGYKAVINGVGIGVRYSVHSAFIVNCIGKDENMSGNYFGIKADAAVVFGFTGAGFVGEKGVCVVGGINFASIGAGGSLSSLQIYE